MNIQLLKSLETLHSMGYTHNDIKPGNIMLDKISGDENSNIQATLIDFGFSTKFQNSQEEHL